MQPCNPITFQREWRTEDPSFHATIARYPVLKGYFGDKAPPLLNGEDYQITSKVGKGGYGDVYLALNKIDMKHYVMKLDNGRTAPYEIYHLMNEFMFQDQAHNVLKPKYNVPQPKGFVRMEMQPGKHSYMMVSEFCAVVPSVTCSLSMQQALNEHARGTPLLTTEEWKVACAKLIEIAYHLQSFDIYHLDIKPDNVLLQFTQNCVHPVLIDFGLSLRKNSLTSGTVKEPGPDPNKHYPHYGRELFTSHIPLRTSDLYGVSFIIHQVAERLSLNTVLRMIKEYRKQKPEDRMKHNQLNRSIEIWFREDMIQNKV